MVGLSFGKAPCPPFDVAARGIVVFPHHFFKVLEIEEINFSNIQKHFVFHNLLY